MAEKNQQVYPLAPAVADPRSDEESDLQSKEFRRKRRIKIAGYIVAFAVFQCIVIAVFAVTVMKYRTPKFRLGKITVETLVSTPAPSPSFNTSFLAQFTVKNTNFGPYKFDKTTATFTYGGVTVGQVDIPKGKAGFRSTKKIKVAVGLDSSALTSTSSLGTEINSEVLTLSTQAKLSGKVELMFVMKKKKSAQMNCTIKIHLKTNTLQSLECN
ncbi:hypothetical protein L1049_006654 [Liquidambar formosana]|uniref:Late embryogenesis abundant protein LEA-2 subgroup domain-containing protein n=1 Tax=Liquidambar formosana TaxID=63359 RepID=A0AAP0RHL2_LIQFO